MNRARPSATRAPLLLLVDLQRDFLAVPGLDPSAGAVIGRADLLLRAARDGGCPVIHVRTTIDAERDDRMTHWRRKGLWRCVAGTAGHAPPPELAERAGERVLAKTGFAPPGLAARVEETGADSVILAGVMPHACVRQAALDLHQAGLRVWIARDAVGSDDPLHAAITLRYLEDRCTGIASSGELAQALR